jgi:hypothetical protein
MRLSKTLIAVLACVTTIMLPAPTYSYQTARVKARTPVLQTEITKEKIEAILSDLERAAKEKDVAGHAAYLAPDLQVKSKFGDTPMVQLNRAQYLAVHKQALEITLYYQYVRKSMNIKIAPDGQSATVRIEAFEMATLAQGTVAATTNEVVIFKIYKGKILIASLDATSVPA